MNELWERWALAQLLRLFEEEHGHPFTVTDAMVREFEPGGFRIAAEHDVLWCEWRLRVEFDSDGGDGDPGRNEGSLQLGAAGDGGS